MRASRVRLAASMSVLFLFATVVVWVRSYDELIFRAYRGNLVVMYVRGGLWTDNSPNGERNAFREIEGHLANAVAGRATFAGADHRALGFRYYWMSDYATGIEIPFPYIALIPLAATVVFGLLLRRQRRRQRAGLCLACGYDLRASADGKCPECGSITSSRSAAITEVR